MNANLKPALPRPVDEWKEFRPAEFSRQSPRSVGLKLLVSAFLVAVLLLIWVFLKPHISGTVVQIRKAISGPGESPVASAKHRVAVGRTHREGARAHRPEQPRGDEAAPGPFEVYLLDGDRYIRVTASDRSVLLNTQTGETTWINSDTVADTQR